MSSTTWAYRESGSRDLRIDFIRGIAIVMMVVAHVEVFSAFNLLTSERLGFISGAEGFVLLAGYVLGQLNRSRVANVGGLTAAYLTWSRAMLLYAVNLAIVLVVFLLSRLPFLDTFAITHFTDRISGTEYPLYAVGDFSLERFLNDWLLLRVGPHQTQILGLYVVLLLITPLVVAVFSRRKTLWILGVSWLVYGIYQWQPTNVTHAEFEGGFPLLCWQLLYFHGLALGWHRQRVAFFLQQPAGRLLALAGCVGAVVLAFIAQNRGVPPFPEALRPHLISNHWLHDIYVGYSLKNSLGVLRLVNDVCFYFGLYVLLTYAWAPFRRLFAWYLVPVGQASLYVFIVHVMVVWLASLLVTFQFSTINWGLNTALHFAVLLVLWAMVRWKVGMRFIPT